MHGTDFGPESGDMVKERLWDVGDEMLKLVEDQRRESRPSISERYCGDGHRERCVPIFILVSERSCAAPKLLREYQGLPSAQCRQQKLLFNSLPKERLIITCKRVIQCISIKLGDGAEGRVAERALLHHQR